MAITFFASRTLARNAAKELNNGKVKDMGSTAPTGERWAVEYTSKSDVVKALANDAAEVVIDVELVLSEPGDLNGIPTWLGQPGIGKTFEPHNSILIVDDISNCVSTDKLQEIIQQSEEIKRRPVNADMSNMYGKPVIMRTRKTNSPVEVRVKRNKGKLINSALMEALNRIN